ncbi:MAG: lysostaphin resistance A-like protein [Terracidiphilus sp.]
MTKDPEFDPLNPNAGTPASEPQPWKDDEDEIPSFEGMVFSSYLDPAELTGESWDQPQPIPEMPLTIWEDTPLTEDDILKVIASSKQQPELAQSSEDEPTARAEHAEDWIPATEPFEEDRAPLGRRAQNAKRGGLYGNLADSSWINKDWLPPVQSAREEKHVDPAPLNTRKAQDLSPLDQASDTQGAVHSEPAKSVEGLEAEPQPVPLFYDRSSAYSNELAPPSDAQMQTAEVADHAAESERIDQFKTHLDERPLFHTWYETEQKAPDQNRIPHFGHLVVLALIGFGGLVGAILLMRGALYFHLFGVSTVQKASSDIHYTIGFMASLYLISFGLAALIFPLIWHKSFFAGLQWNFASARHRFKLLLGAAFVCFLLAMVDEVVLPGPTNAPIDKLFETRTAAWLLFAFGVTFAPFFEEIIFRGFLLPTLCTAFDWYGEKLTGNSSPPLDGGDHPHWSLFAMILGSIATSIPFALMHAEQTAWSLGPFLLLVAVSLVLCWARLATRSLAASVLVHSSYNFLLFSLMLLGTGGFRHLDKM